MAVDYEEKEQRKQARLDAKPWLMRNLDVAGKITLPVSPATIITILLVLVNLYYTFAETRWAEASHILVKPKDDTSKESHQATKKLLTEMKQEIGSGDLKRFGDFAAKYSQCPSKARKGDLGRFKPGDMAPPFDKVIFDPKSSTETALGPVQTMFGYHLIYIRQRKIWSKCNQTAEKSQKQTRKQKTEPNKK